MNAVIKCNCGRRILAKDVLQTGYYLRLFGPSFVYVKYRCPHCKKLGEQFVRQKQWEEGILNEVPCEMTPKEKKRFAEMGSIDIHECIDAHFELERLGSLAEIREALEGSKS